MDWGIDAPDGSGDDKRVRRCPLTASQANVHEVHPMWETDATAQTVDLESTDPVGRNPRGGRRLLLLP
jgi:hypothetical protein